MKVAILAGGLGTRLIQETAFKPKPMVEIGGYPILWHIMMHYSHFDFNEFVIALGYKGIYVKRWMQEYVALHRNMTVKTRLRSTTYVEQIEQDWIVHLVDTGLETNTGGRIKRLANWLDDQTFMLTWGDGVSNIDLKALLDFHKFHGKLATLTTVRPPARFGHLVLKGNRVEEFKEKPKDLDFWINGAYFVLEPGVFDYIQDDNTSWERDSLVKIAKDGQLMAYHHTGFWQCMDTLPEKIKLEKMWNNGHAPWNIWDK